MSVQGMVWVLEEAPDLPKHLVGTLTGLANHADQNGRGAYPSQELLAWYARKDERSIRRDLEQLEQLELIARGDQRMVLHLPSDKRPVVYDLMMHRKRDPRPDARQAGRPKKAQVSEGSEIGGTPTSAGITPLENRGDAHVRGDADVQIGGTSATNRGDAHVPLTVLEPSLEPKTPPTPQSEPPAPGPAQAVTGGIDSLTIEERTNLIEAVDQAVQARAGAAGWSRSQVADAARIAIEAGFPAELVARDVVRLAGDKPTGSGNDGTEYPTRLVHFLRDRARRAAAAAAPVSPATAPPGPFTYLDVDRPRCPVHPGHPADNCAPHKVDAMIAAKEAEEALEVAEHGPAPTTGADARRLAAEAIAAARAKRGAGSPPAPLRRHQPRPGGSNLGGLLGAFSIPAEDLDAAAADLAEQGDADPYAAQYAAPDREDAHAV